jgi:hypothetical protein
MIHVWETPLEIRAAAGNIISGYAARFDVESSDLGGYHETIRSGAFTAALALPDDVLATLEHDPEQCIGRRSDGSLELREAGIIGLAFKITLPDTELGRDTFRRVKSGDLNSCSFAFRAGNDSWQRSNDRVLRTIETVAQLLDVSLVKRPAYPKTSVTVGSKPIVRSAPNLDAYRLRLLEISCSPSLERK